LNLRIAELYNQYTVYAPVGYFVGILFFTGIQFMMHQNAYYIPQKMKLGFSEVYANPLDWSNTITNKTNINFIGEVLYNHYYVYLWFAGLILLVAMIGSIVLTVDFDYHASRQEIIYSNTKSIDSCLIYITAHGEVPLKRETRNLC